LVSSGYGTHEEGNGKTTHGGNKKGNYRKAAVNQPDEPFGDNLNQHQNDQSYLHWRPEYV
jgi:hypothetical protein